MIKAVLGKINELALLLYKVLGWSDHRVFWEIEEKICKASYGKVKM